jgi:hypothetical protein
MGLRPHSPPSVAQWRFGPGARLVAVRAGMVSDAGEPDRRQGPEPGPDSLYPCRSVLVAPASAK